MPENPFGDDAARPRRVNPFGEEPEPQSPADAAGTVRAAAQRIRGLRTQLGAEGLTLSGTRELIDSLAAALEAIAGSLRGLED